MVLRLGLIITITTLITTLATEIRHLESVNGSLRPTMAQITNRVDTVPVHTLLALVDTVSNMFSILFPNFTFVLGSYGWHVGL